MTQPMHNKVESSRSADDAEIINFALVRNWLSFGFRTLKRRRWFVILTTAAFLGLAFAALAILPPKYSVECQLLAQRNEVLVTRSDTPGNDPSVSAHDTILSTENLYALAKETNLLKEWDARRAPVLKLKDKVLSWFRTPQTDQQRLKGVVEFLRERMAVWSENGKITIQLAWPDGEMAYRLVDAAQRSFLESRHVQEVSTFSESLAILEGHAADLARQVDKALAELQSLRKGSGTVQPAGEDKPQKKPRMTSAAPQPTPAANEAAEADARERARRLAELNVSITAKQRIVDDLEESRRRRVAELQASLQEKRTTYTEAHPAVTEVKQALQAASAASPQVQRLKKELEQLRAEQERLQAVDQSEQQSAKGAAPRHYSSSLASPTSTTSSNPTMALAEALRDDSSDPAVRYARSKLEFAIQNHHQVEEKIRATRMDLETAQAAFKYRYVLVIPPERPRDPIWPKKGLILAAALFCGLLIGVFGAVAFELREDIVSERWQIEQLLSLPVLGEVALTESLRERSPG